MAAGFISAGFIMHGARYAMAAGLFHIEEQVQSLEDAVFNNPAYAFDLSKTIIESACKTILHERNVTFADGDDLPKLFKKVAQSNLPFLPAAVSGEASVHKSLEKTLNGLHTAMLGVCELRNVCGFASHGTDGPRPPLESVQAILAAATADTIVGFLYRVHRQDLDEPESDGVGFDENHVFNQ
jgi:hypothetical protein